MTQSNDAGWAIKEAHKIAELFGYSERIKLDTYAEKKIATALRQARDRGLEAGLKYCDGQRDWHMKHERFCCAKTAIECRNGIRALKVSSGEGERT